MVYEVIIGEKLDRSTHDADLQALTWIASKCPMEVGPVIYRARRIVSERDGLRYDLIGDCHRVDNRSIDNPISNPISASNTPLILSPNPTSREVYVTSSEEMTGLISISTMDGIDVMNVDINKSTQIKLITNNLKSGIYMVSYRSKTGNIQTAKLMIVK